MKVQIVDMRKINSDKTSVKAYMTLILSTDEMEVTIKDVSLVYAKSKDTYFINFPFVKYESEGKTVFKSLVFINPKDILSDITKQVLTVYNGNKQQPDNDEDLGLLPF